MFVSGFRSPDTLFVLAYAVVLLNTDLHTRALKRDARRMRREDFVRNLRGVDAGADPDREMLEGVYDRIRRNEFRPGPDHVSQVKNQTLLSTVSLLLRESMLSGRECIKWGGGPGSFF